MTHDRTAKNFETVHCSLSVSDRSTAYCRRCPCSKEKDRGKGAASVNDLQSCSLHLLNTSAVMLGV